MAGEARTHRYLRSANVPNSKSYERPKTSTVSRVALYGVFLL